MEAVERAWSALTSMWIALGYDVLAINEHKVEVGLVFLPTNIVFRTKANIGFSILVRSFAKI